MSATCYIDQHYTAESRSIGLSIKGFFAKVGQVFSAMLAPDEQARQHRANYCSLLKTLDNWTTLYRRTLDMDMDTQEAILEDRSLTSEVLVHYQEMKEGADQMVSLFMAFANLGLPVNEQKQQWLAFCSRNLQRSVQAMEANLVHLDSQPQSPIANSNELALAV